MINQDIEEGIERYIRHMRKMALLTDDQIKIMISHIRDQDPDSIGVTSINIDRYIDEIRQMALVSDAQLRSSLRDAASKDSALQNMFEDAAQKRLLSEMKDIAKDIRSDPRKFARRVDSDIGLKL